MSIEALAYEQTYNQGIAKIRQGQSAEALTLFQQAFGLAKNPSQKTNAILQISHAMPVAEEKEALQMLLEYRKTSDKLPAASEAILELRIGVLHARQKQYAAAAPSLSYATSSNKLSERDLLLAYDMLSNSLLHLGKYEESLKVLNNWENLPTIPVNDYSRLMTRRAAVFGQMKRFEEAYQAGTEAADLPGISPLNQALAWQMLASIAFANEKNPHKAKIYSEKSKAVKDGQWGFNLKLHEEILKACATNTP